MRLSDHTPDVSHALDAEDFIPAGTEHGGYVHECFECGFNLFNVMVMFEDYEVAGYMLEMTCVSCGSKMTAPTLVDHPAYQE